jgi:hypothetical protein
MELIKYLFIAVVTGYFIALTCLIVNLIVENKLNKK